MVAKMKDQMTKKHDLTAADKSLVEDLKEFLRTWNHIGECSIVDNPPEADDDDDGVAAGAYSESGLA